ncbi:hypothetical protein KKA15_00570 [Patescibacteria group bacterium]|nr:hypothetical protein [Patescibacteria group bacterium]
MTILDGEDLCLECWQKFLDRIKDKQGEEYLQDIKNDSCRTSEVADTRKSADGWFGIIQNDSTGV